MSAFSKDDIRILATREYMLDNSTLDEHFSFMKYQIENPFDTGDANYFKKIKKLIPDKDVLYEVCEKVLEMIASEYPSLDIDYPDDVGLVDFTDSVYKFLVRSIRKELYIFLREYLYNNKNRKALISEYQDVKIQNYPKSVYGKKEYYILISKMPSIISTIASLDIDMDTFMEYIDRDDDSPVYIQLIQKYFTNGWITDHGIYNDIMKKFKNSDHFDQVVNKLSMKMKETFIDPYLQSNSLDEVKPSIVVDYDQDDLVDDEDFEQEDPDEDE